MTPDDKTVWVWIYELKHLGSWPGDEYTGHNQPVLVRLASDCDSQAAEQAAAVWEEAIKEVMRINANGSPMTEFGRGVIAACADMAVYCNQQVQQAQQARKGVGGGP